MPLPVVNGVTMTSQRRRAILALYKVGGHLAPASGEKRIPGEAQRKIFKMSTSAVAGMERDGIIVRDMNKTSTRSVTLRPEWMEWAKTATEEGGTTRRQSRRSPQQQRRIPRRRKRTADVELEEVPLPQVGTTVTVFLIQQDEDGTQYVGLRNGSKSWLTRVHAHSDRER